MSAIQFLPINLDRDFELCLQFLCDAFVSSYGNADELIQMGGAEGYRSWLEELVSTFPQGAVHVWRKDRVVGQIEMRIRADSGVGMVVLFYLVPEERGGPLGAELQAYVLGILSQHRVQKARLSVSPANARAMKYYTKYGWRDLGPRPDRPYVHAMEIDLEESNCKIKPDDTSSKKSMLDK